MKIGSFVIGGLAGAAIVMMIQRNQTMSAVASSVGNNVKQRMNGWKDGAIDKALNMKFSGGFKRSGSESHAERSSASGHGSPSSRESGLEAIKELISQDPAVGKEVEAILQQNGHPRN